MLVRRVDVKTIGLVLLGIALLLVFWFLLIFAFALFGMLEGWHLGVLFAVAAVGAVKVCRSVRRRFNGRVSAPTSP